MSPVIVLFFSLIRFFVRSATHTHKVSVGMAAGMVFCLFLLSVRGEGGSSSRIHANEFQKNPVVSTNGQFILMLDPAGDAEHAGRVLHDCYERGATLQCCRILQQQLEKKLLNVRVVLTRLPGEPPLQPLQHANFCNKLNADLFISIHFYKEPTTTASKVWIYFFKDENVFGVPHQHRLIFYPCDKIWLLYHEETKKLVGAVEKAYKQYKNVEVHKPQGIPFKPLVGIKAPAIALEFGIADMQQLQDSIEPLQAVLEHYFRE